MENGISGMMYWWNPILNRLLTYFIYSLGCAVTGALFGAAVGFILTHFMGFNGTVYFLGWKTDRYAWRFIGDIAMKLAIPGALLGVIIGAGNINGWR